MHVMMHCNGESDSARVSVRDIGVHGVTVLIGSTNDEWILFLPDLDEVERVGQEIVEGVRWLREELAEKKRAVATSAPF